MNPATGGGRKGTLQATGHAMAKPASLADDGQGRQPQSVAAIMLANVEAARNSPPNLRCVFE